MIGDSLAPARRRLLLLVTGLLAVVLVGVVVAVVVTREGETAPVDQSRLGPVLLVPGYGGSTRSLRFLESYLASEGREVTIVDPPGNGTDDLRDQAENLAGSVDDALAESGAESVDLVGYSAGGVVVRWYVAELDGAPLTRRVVTLASPHHGTDLAALGAEVGGAGCPEACRQLDPDSDLLATLNRGDETPSGPQWAALWTEDDETVVPGSSGELEGALSFPVQEVCPSLTVSHGDMPATAPTILMVAAELGRADPVLPPGSVCDEELSFAG